ncbi:MAG TPA: hypothetical protein VL172_18815, partial [Kofleriaceae bacterium]|nr:hypothetical protein [Kofleriaceae bacterium]
EESMQVIDALDRAGIDLIEVSGGNYQSPAMMGRGEVAATLRESTRAREAYFLDHVTAARARTRLPILLTGGLRTAEGMAAALADGGADLIGMARPLILEPDLPARLLSGHAEGARPVSVRSRVKLIDAALQAAWYQRQLHRIARGADPDPGLGRWTTIGQAFLSNYAVSPL